MLTTLSRIAEQELGLGSFVLSGELKAIASETLKIYINT
jgi:hypothetical protein